MKLITFTQGHNGWRPGNLKGIEINNIKPIRRNQINESGFVYNIYKGVVSDEVATFLKLQGGFRIEEIPAGYDK